MFEGLSLSFVSDFFYLGIIPAIIGFIVMLVCLKEEERYSFIVNFFISLAAAIGIFILSCIIIYVFYYALIAIAGVGMFIAIIFVLVLCMLDGDF